MLALAGLHEGSIYSNIVYREIAGYTRLLYGVL